MGIGTMCITLLRSCKEDEGYLLEPMTGCVAGVMPVVVTKRAGPHLSTHPPMRFLASTARILMFASFSAEHL